MAFAIRFSTFAKKVNSTARPGSYAEYAGVLRSGSSVMNPIFDIDADGSLPNYNYAYVPAFGRYYYVTDWTLDGRLAVCSMSVDTLATYKDEIGLADLYILRSAELNDPYLTDAMYPMKNKVSTAVAYGDVDGDSQLLFPSALQDGGAYVIGIAGKVTSDDNPLGGITYMVLSEAAFSDFRNALFSDSLSWYKAGDTEKDTGLKALGDSLAKMIFDPFQYVVSCCWVPVKPLTTGTVYNLWNVGFWPFETDNGIEILDPTFNGGRTKTFILPKHPQAERGKYLNTSPFSSYQLVINGLGSYPIDASKIVDATRIQMKVNYDVASETSWFRIVAQVPNSSGSGYSDHTLLEAPANFVVPIQLAKAGDLDIGNFSNFASQAAASVVTAFAGGVPSIPNPTGLFTPNVQTVGGVGAYSNVLICIPVIEAIFYEVADEDNPHKGRPLCKEYKPSVLGGYMECLDGDLAIAGTAAENEEVKNYLETGFFYE